MNQRERHERTMEAAEDWRKASPEMAYAVTDGLAKDLAKPGRRITRTTLQQRIICEVGSPRVIRIFEVVKNEEDGGIIEAQDANGIVWACAATTEGLQQALYGMSITIIGSMR